jgi:hypothetical protein
MNNGVRIYVATFVVLVLAVIGSYYLGENFNLTGNVVFNQYTNESTCLANNYTWTNFTNQTCTNVTNCVNQTYEYNCEPCLQYEDINGTQGNCTNWTICSNTNQTCTIEQNCTTEIIGGECTGNICDDDHLSLCLNSTTCNSSSGYWYNSSCNKYQCTLDVHCSSGNVCKSKKCVQAIVVEAPVEAPVEEPVVQAPVVEAPVEVPEVKELTANDIHSFSLISGNSKEVKWIVKNTGNVQLSECKLSSNGDYSSWISFVSEIPNINAGEQKEFALNVAVPENTSEGNYSLRLFTNCTGASISKEFILNVLSEKLEVSILETERTSKGKVKVQYSLQELSGKEQEVNLYFSLVNSAGQEVSNISINKSIDANKLKDYKVSLDVNKSLEGNLTLAVKFNSETFSNSVQEPISLGSFIGGFVIFEGVETGSIIIFVLVVLALVLSLVIIKLMRRNNKKEDKNKIKKKK